MALAVLAGEVEVLAGVSTLSSAGPIRGLDDQTSATTPANQDDFTAMKGDLTSIKMFVAAYEEGTFTAAAVRENATQSGVSQHIAQLEDLLGVTLFLRAKVGVSPTPAAQSLYSKCVELLRVHHHAIESVRQFGQGLSGNVTMGLMPTLTQAALGPTLTAFSKAHPNVRPLVMEAFSASLTDSILAEEIDFAILPAFEGRTGIHLLHFGTVPEVLVSASGGSLRHRQPVALRDLESLKLVVPGDQNTRRRTIETYCTAYGAKIDQLFELDSLAGTLDFVGQSDWQAILPMPAVMNRLDGSVLTINPIADPPLQMEMVVISRANKSLRPSAHAFIEALAETVASLNRQWNDFAGQG
ncbi:MAG TPA: LysR family transcriptional regulator [Caulobacteraceae bacterium]|nr:LysR family transcriptional regulator [Caulobacteraceae bacterium]